MFNKRTWSQTQDIENVWLSKNPIHQSPPRAVTHSGYYERKPEFLTIFDCPPIAQAGTISHNDEFHT